MAAIDNVKDLLAEKEELQACYYGAIPPNVSKILTEFNFAVINRDNSVVSDGTIKDIYAVTIVFEERIPDGYTEALIKEIEALKWKFMRERGISYNYSVSMNTLLVLESATFYICKAKRWC